MSSTHALGCLHRIARPGLSLDSHTVTSKRHQYACVPHVARLLLDLLELWPFAEGRALRAVVRWCVEVEQLARGSAQYLYPKALRTPTRHANGEIRPAAIQPTTEPWQSERTRETERGGGGVFLGKNSTPQGQGPEPSSPARRKWCRWKPTSKPSTAGRATCTGTGAAPLLAGEGGWETFIWEYLCILGNMASRMCALYTSATSFSERTTIHKRQSFCGQERFLHVEDERGK